MIRRATAGLLVFAALVACGKEKAALKDSVPVATSTSPATPAAGAPDCPRTGHWTVCQLRKRLEQAGLAPRDTTTIGDLPSLDVKPTLLMLGNAGLAYYLFADTTARNRAAATLDTSRYIVQTKPLSMRNEATRIENDNALAILLSRNEHQRERVADAITAGPPQP